MMLLPWIGAFLLIVGETVACLRWRNLAQVLIWSTLAECGLVLIGFSGGEIGQLGAAMHIVYQLVMRGLMLGAAIRLAETSGGWSLDRLAGVGHRSPVHAVLFAFGMFSVLGLSPFKGALSRFLVLYDLVVHGQWLIAAIVTLASIVAAIYAIRVIQGICFTEAPAAVDGPGEPRGAAPLRWFHPSDLIVVALAVATAAFNLVPEQVADIATAIFRVNAPLPQIEGPWPAVVLLPYVGAFAIWGLGYISPRARDIGAITLAAATLLLAATSGDLDPISHAFALLFAGVMLLVTLYSPAYIRHKGGEQRYWFFLFLMSGSLLGVATASNLGSFYLFWELMTWSSYLLVVHSRSAEALKAGIRYFVMCGGGAYVMLLGIVGIIAATGSFEIAGLGSRLARLDWATGTLLVSCVFVGFGVKSGLVPLHAALAAADPAAPSSVSAPMSSILTKTGVLGLLKILLAGFGVGLWAAGSAKWANFGYFVTFIGVISLLCGEVMAWRQTDVKRMLAYSTIAQLGEITAVLGLGGAMAVAAATTHVLIHGVTKTLLFLGVGALVMRTGSRRIADLAGIGRTMPLTTLFLTIGLLSIMGLPPFGGFIGKFAMVWASVRSGAIPVAVALLLGGVIGVLYYGRFIRIICFDAPSVQAATAHEAPRSMLVPLGLAAAFLVCVGLVPNIVFGLATAVAVEVATARGVVMETWPNFAASWPWAATIAAVTSLATLTIGRGGLRIAGVIAVGGISLAFVAVLAEAGRYNAIYFPFALVISGVGVLNLTHSIGYMVHHGHRPERFLGMFTLMIAGLLGMAGSSDLFSFLFFWEIMSSWTLWFAIIHEETPYALREGFKYFTFNIVGASFLFLGVAAMAVAAGSFSFIALPGALNGMLIKTAILGIGAALLGFAMKAAMLTVRVDWQMHPAPAPTPVSGYISAVLLKSGPLGVFNLLVLFGGAAALSRFGNVGGLDPFSYTLAVIGAITAIWAGLMAFIQTGIKRLLIYSTVSQLGYVMCGVALGNALATAGGLFHAINHVLLKDTLFLAAGAILAQQRVTDLDELGGVGRRMPWTFAFFTFSGLSLAGLPPLNGLESKWLLYEGALTSGHPFIALALLAASLTTLAAILKFVHAAFLGAPSPQSDQLREASPTMLVPMALLCLLSFIVGLVPGLVLVPISLIQAELGLPAIEATWLGPLPGPWGWHPLVLWGPLLALLAVGWGVVRAGRPAVRFSRAHTCGVDLEPRRMRVAASQLYRGPARLVRQFLPIYEDQP